MLVLVKPKRLTDPFFPRQHLTGTIYGNQEIGTPPTSAFETGVKSDCGAVEEILEEQRLNMFTALSKGGLSDGR